ncbi:unnamed protein product [Closterium sp. NIES-53]
MAAWSAGISADLLGGALLPAADNGASRPLGIADRRSPPSCRHSFCSSPLPNSTLFSPGARDSPGVSCLVSVRAPLSRVRAISASAASSSDTDGPDLSPRPSLPDSTPRAVLDFPPAEGFGEELTKLLTMLPRKVRDVLQRHPAVHSLVEVVLDLGRRPVARFPLGDVFLCEEVVTAGDIEYCVSQVAPSLSPSPPASVPLAISLTACKHPTPPLHARPFHVPHCLPLLLLPFSSLPSSLVPFSPPSLCAGRGVRRGQPRGDRPHAAPHQRDPQPRGEDHRADVPRGARDFGQRGNGARPGGGGGVRAAHGRAGRGEDHCHQVTGERRWGNGDGREAEDLRYL